MGATFRSVKFLCQGVAFIKLHLDVHEGDPVGKTGLVCRCFGAQCSVCLPEGKSSEGLCSDSACPFTDSSGQGSTDDLSFPDLHYFSVELRHMVLCLCIYIGFILG